MFFKDMQTGSSTVSENLNQMAKYATPLIERRVFAEEQSITRGEGELYEAYLLRVKIHREKYIEPYMDWIDKLMTVLKE